ncbi:uncharacterized protein YceK [Pseudomonas duriflava]|uniref:Uncharacterized protein YceK n=2 Tax=Pseudomonas duriflava TaxID=459528 RepID=A0A562Q897_9PSED|nr:uncharacterized protein YceK [Pseudomonas duriflava]
MLMLLSGCASVGALNANKPGAPLVYAGTRLDWYALQGGCCPAERFGVEAPTYPALDLPASLLLDTVLFPLALAKVLGVGLIVRGGS